MEINEYRPKQNRINKAASEYEASQVKAQQIKAPKNNQKPVHFNKNEQTTIKGEIIDLRYQEVKIRLEPSGQIISARISGELPLSIGQTAEFLISDQTDGLITLKYIQAGNSPINDIIQKALFASGYTASERNVSIVQELLNYQMPVDKNTILQLIKLTSTYPDVDISTLVLMHKNGLPINIASIAQFEAYQKGNHQILNQLKSLIYQINDIKSYDIRSNNIHSSVNDTKANRHMSIINENNTDNIEANIKDLTYNSLSLGRTETGSALSWDIPLDDFLEFQRNLLNLLKDETRSQEQVHPNTTVRYILSDNELKELQNTIINKINEGIYYDDEMAENIKHQLLGGTISLEGLLAITHKMNGSESTPSLTERTTLPVTIARAFIDMSQFLSDSSKDKLVTLLRSENYSDMITKALHTRWTISPNDLIIKDRVKDFFNRLDKDLKLLDKLADSISISHQDVKASINKLQDKLQFMKDLNELFIHLQLPIRLTEQDVHGDLYVFTHKNHRTSDKERLNILLHLDMANLGSMDIHMSMMNRNINAVFYLEKSSEHIISMHLHELINSLNDKGFLFNAKTQISNNKPDFINDILQQDVPNSNTHRYSFDIRA